jgi:hypothetical protein
MLAIAVAIVRLVEHEEALVRVPKTFDERSPPALRILLVPHREAFLFGEVEPYPFRLVVTPVFRALVAMVRICDGVDLFDGVGRGILTESALNDDVIVSLLR